MSKVLAPPHPLVKHWIFVMRNDQPPTAISLNSFEIVSGNAIAEIGRLLMFEASREWLPMVVGEIMTPVGATSVELIERISFGSVLQACLMPCVHSVASASQHRSICVKGNLVLKGNLFLRYVPHSLANSLDKMFYIEILTIICFFGETKDSNHYLFAGMVSRGRTFYATILTSKQQFTGEEEIGLVWMHLLAVAGATVVSSSFGKDEKMAKSEVAVATTLADALYMKDDEVIAAKREHLALTVNETMKKPSRMKIVDNEKSGRVTYQKLKKRC
ncbi:hypothetical protein HID58_009971 [Brassica napus]|uniref:Uncharacterized protein n=1 Tax=Brassica napus TaxID=3708 RepID=A0ABQ8DU26_BRANA|nr:hypothetical protein HID58_009971 [Brassica napus]